MHFARKVLVPICASTGTLALLSANYLWFGDWSHVNPYHPLLASYKVLEKNRWNTGSNLPGEVTISPALKARNYRRLGDYREALRVASEDTLNEDSAGEAFKASIASGDTVHCRSSIWAIQSTTLDLGTNELDFLDRHFSANPPSLGGVFHVYEMSAPAIQ